jgi:8-oxo-dGTP diphosphatase
VSPQKYQHITRVAAGFVRDGRRVLIARRKQGGPFGGLWEFPGGKIEPGESPEECLRRELLEEFGMDASIGGLFASNVHPYEGMTIELLVYRASFVRGRIDLTVHDEARWVLPDELMDYGFLPADVPIVKKIAAGEI